ncbi:hypothetical protein MUN84_08360 [Hymenobacter sp. 5516J-16]|uniref:hypothetical protein n=1 Tax=Hymenobacter sp. 5516J-16 TaxID=2932253 RepID=UPI001FD1CFEF|nr:hypothetical protein [Hymenobacter sp. 5516J-16]UOQ78550.1 hypothetical protein MUN84_08360 [Hymenobacter sp. 5516J-16]
MPEALTLFSAVKGLVGPFGSIGKEIIKRFNQPKLACWMPLTTGRHMPAGDIPPDQGFSRAYRVEDEILWQYKLTITNNSLHTAYKLRLVEPESTHLEQIMDYTVPLEGHKSVTYAFTVIGAFDSSEEAGIAQFDYCPYEEFRIEYENASGRRFYTLFKPNEFKIELRNEYGSVK